MISIQVDVDNLWSYEHEFGVAASGDYDRIYDQALPLMLSELQRFNAAATFFIVGRDLELQSCRDFCAEAVKQGHEIANHSYHHFADLSRLSYAAKETEIRRCGEALEQTTNRTVRGFRSPGYYLDDDIIGILIANNYLYDTSVLPSFANLFMGTFIAWRSGKRLKKSFGRKRYGFVSQGICRIESRHHPGRSLFEVPIACSPILRLPLHSTMVFLLGDRYQNFVRGTLMRRTTPMIYLFHGIDTLANIFPSLLTERVPALRYSVEKRTDFIREILSSVAGEQLLTAEEFVLAQTSAPVSRSRLLSLPMKAR